MSQKNPFSLTSNKTKIKESQPIIDANFTHSLCIGQTGSGKTTSYIYPNLSNRMKLNHGILFFDIKGNEHQAVKYLAKQEGRLKDIVEIGKPWGENINILENLKESEFISLMESIINKPEDGGNNTFFYLASISLAQTIYNIYSKICIINQELEEMGFDYRYNYFEYQAFTLFDIYMAVQTIDDMYTFIQKISYAIFTLEDDGFLKFVKKNDDLFSSCFEKDTIKANKAKNILLNVSQVRRYLSDLDNYNVKKEDRQDRSKFDPSLISILNTIAKPMQSMVHSMGDSINKRENPFKIAQALNEGKIIIVNVRVNSDKILKTMLAKLYENFLDRNLLDAKKRKPITIFIDEAQRLIDKDLPLDVLRSSKVDVLMAIQSESQLISKFKKYDDWKQLSINIHKKLTFHSSLTHENDLSNFVVAPDELETFEFLYEKENTKYISIPIFLEEEFLKTTDVEYQSKVLKLKGLKKNEYYDFNPKHFERENEVLIKSSKNETIGYKKWFTQDDIEQVKNEYDLINYQTMLKDEGFYDDAEDESSSEENDFNFFDDI